VRASYAQEALATADFFKAQGVPDYTHLISFDQDDSFGQAGYDGLKKAYPTVFAGALQWSTNPEPAEPIKRFRYKRNDNNSVPAQVVAATTHLNTLLGGGTTIKHVGIMMTDTYGAARAFIEGVRRWQYDSDQTNDKANRLKLYFSNVSFVGPNALAEELLSAGMIMKPGAGLVPFTDSVVVSQVVPNYQDDATEIVTAYNRLITAGSYKKSFTSLEGYISARVFIAGLEAHKGPFQPSTLVQTLEQLPDLSLGIGASAGFSPTNHQYSNTVWGTTIQADGTFKNRYYWTAGRPIEFF
jgi:hypothetical protein